MKPAPLTVSASLHFCLAAVLLAVHGAPRVPRFASRVLEVVWLPSQPPRSPAMRDAARKIDAGFSGLATAVRAPATRAPLLVAAPAPLSHLRATPAVVRVLDRPAAPSRTEYNRPPAYPETARQSGMEGTVVLAVGVAPTGAPDAVAVTASSGFALLDEAARNAVRRWSFDPAYHAGIPVRGFAKVAVRFDLVDAD